MFRLADSFNTFHKYNLPENNSIFECVSIDKIELLFEVTYHLFQIKTMLKQKLH